MKNILYVGLLLLAVSCGKMSPKGDVEIKDVELSEFTNLDAKGKFRLFYVQGPHNYVSVEAAPNFIDNLNINVNNGTLSITEKRETEGLSLYNLTIYGKNNFADVKMSDSVELNISSQMSVKDFRLTLKDQAKFIGAVISEKVWVDMAQKSKANINGKTNMAYIKISDTASIISPYWFVENLEIDSKNQNYTEVNVEKELSGSITNTSKLNYYGDPEKKIKVNEKASIEKKQLN